jgi:hypothetical protein
MLERNYFQQHDLKNIILRQDTHQFSALRTKLAVFLPLGIELLIILGGQTIDSTIFFKKISFNVTGGVLIVFFKETIRHTLLFSPLSSSLW